MKRVMRYLIVSIVGILAVICAIILTVNVIGPGKPALNNPTMSPHPPPQIIYPEDYDKKNASYEPNNVTVGFWTSPPSLEEFGAKYGGTLIDSSEDYGYIPKSVVFATFTTSNMTDFIKKVASDPYVRYAEPNQIGHLDDRVYNVSAEPLDNPN